MRTSHKKTPYSKWRANKFGHAPATINGIKGTFKFKRTLQNPAIKSDASVGLTRGEQVEALALEAEARRDQGRTYAGVTPIR